MRLMTWRALSISHYLAAILEAILAVIRGTATRAILTAAAARGVIGMTPEAGGAGGETGTTRGAAAAAAATAAAAAGSTPRRAKPAWRSPRRWRGW